VGICTLLLVLLLSVAVSASRFAAKLARRKATTEAVLAFGFEVGGLCAAAGLLNMAQIGLGLASGLLAPLQLGEFTECATCCCCVMSAGVHVEW
jgi:hypothetical protein